MNQPFINLIPKFSFTVVDLETTGLSPQKGSTIIEIGGVRISDGTIQSTFQEMVNPGQPIPSKITEITGIRQADVEEAPPLDVVLPRFNNFANDSIYIAHNAAFDLKFLKYFRKTQLNNPSIDTLKMSRQLFDFESHALTNLIKEFDLQRDNAHRALDDALATAELFFILAEELSDPGDFYACGLPDCILEQSPAKSILKEMKEKDISSKREAKEHIPDLISNSPEKLGVNKWSRILAGSTSQSVEKYRDHPGFGIMSDFPQTQIREIINSLISTGSLRQTSGAYPVVLAPESGKNENREEDPLETTPGSPF